MAVSGGALTLASGTVFRVSNTGAALALGSYKLIAAGSGGSVTGAAPSSVTVGGNGVASGAKSSLGVTDSELYLVVAARVSTTPPTLTNSVSGTNLNLSWPLDHTGWRLLVQTNHLAAGISLITNDWDTVANLASTNAVSIPIDTAKPTEFYRMVYPWISAGRSAPSQTLSRTTASVSHPGSLNLTIPWKT